MAGTKDGLFGRSLGVEAQPSLLFARGFGVSVSSGASSVTTGRGRRGRGRRRLFSLIPLLWAAQLLERFF